MCICQKKKKYLKEGESISSPKVFLEALFFTLIVHTHKGRDVATFDVLGEYLHVDMPKDKMILMNLRGGFVDIVCHLTQSINNMRDIKMERRVCI